MKRNILLLIVFVLLAVVAVIVFISNMSKKETNGENLNVFVSILPQKEFVQEVGGEHVNVEALIKPGESPATYSLTSSDLKKLETADIYFQIGYIQFEKANIEQIRSQNTKMEVVQIPQEIDLRYFSDDEHHEHEGEEEHASEAGHEEEEIDPHTWLSIRNAKLYVDTVANELSKLDPQHQDYYIQNAADYKLKLEELRQEIDADLDQVKGETLLVFHPAWGYFARDFGLTQIAIENEGNDPTAAQIAEIIEEAEKEDVTAVFVQKQFSTTAAANIAEELGVEVVQIDPLAQNYIENMKLIAEVFKTKL